MFEKFLELKSTTIMIIAALIIVFFIYMMRKEEEKVSRTKIVVYAGLCISLAFILSYIRLYHFPQGGSITPASMLPMFVFAFIFGPSAGILAGIAYGFLQFIQDPFVVNWLQFLLDYPLAFGAMGLAGMYRKNIAVSVLIGGFGRMFCSFLSGVIFFGSYAPAGMHPVVYSLSINASVIGTDTIICFVIAILPQIQSMIKKLQFQSV